MNIKIKYFFLFLFFTTIAFSQPVENSSKEIPVVVPLENAPTVDASKLKMPISVSNNTNNSGSLLKKADKEVNFTGKSDLVRRKVDFKPNYGVLNEQQNEQYDAVRGDQFFGDFNSDGNFVNVYCKDFMAIDGDRISILVNDKVEVHDVFLTGEYRGFQISLKPGFNKIEFLALNQGESGPNTADFQVLDEKGNVIAKNRWNLATGSKAQFIIIKEVKQGD